MEAVKILAIFLIYLILKIKYLFTNDKKYLNLYNRNKNFINHNNTNIFT